MMRKLVVLGGSSPFTAGLVDALAQRQENAAPGLQPLHLVLVGRDAYHLDVVTTYAQRRLGGAGWRCTGSRDAAGALEGAWGVLHQIRYGDLTLRGLAERLCHVHGVVADETLGPAALLTAVVSRPAIDSTTALVQRHCARAWVLNLTNPLSLVTTLMARDLPRCIGLCELPLATVLQAAAILKRDPAQVEWDYRGLNHRGFIVRLTQEGCDLLPLLAERLNCRARADSGPATVGGITGDCIAELGALPMKYFGLMLRTAVGRPGRADYLVGLREQIAAQLCTDSTRSPPAMREREQSWYPLAVVPMLAALQSAEPVWQMVNVMGADGLVQEQAVQVSEAGVGQHRTPTRTSAAAARWLDRFEWHERAAARAVADPTRAHLRQALEADPSVPGVDTGALLSAMLAEIARHRGPHHAHA